MTFCQSFIFSPFEMACWDTGCPVCAQGIISDHHLEIKKERYYSSTVNVRNISKCPGVQSGC